VCEDISIYELPHRGCSLVFDSTTCMNSRLRTWPCSSRRACSGGGFSKVRVQWPRRTCVLHYLFLSTPNGHVLARKERRPGRRSVASTPLGLVAAGQKISRRLTVVLSMTTIPQEDCGRLPLPLPRPLPRLPRSLSSYLPRWPMVAFEHLSPSFIPFLTPPLRPFVIDSFT
jgi:hypothetical protein